jgi:hypothetical protein
VGIFRCVWHVADRVISWNSGWSGIDRLVDTIPLAPAEQEEEGESTEGTREKGE